MVSGRNIMIVGGVMVFITQGYFGVIGNLPGIAMIFSLFGGVIVAIGYALYLWENRFAGRRGDIDWDSRPRIDDNVLAILPPPTKLKAFDPETGRRLCSFYFYDVNNRLPCLSGCEYPDAKNGACTRQQSIPTCPYPKSREPFVKALMPKPVAWCPGPGGCKHFNELEYICKLQLQGRQQEFIYSFDRKPQNRRIGVLLITLGILPLFIPLLRLLFNISTEFHMQMLLPGVFIAAIGAIIHNHAE